jgi:hypothetical protein
MSTGSDTRDRRAIAAIPCPRCGAPKGMQCGRLPTIRRPRCCLERRKANQERTRLAVVVDGQTITDTLRRGRS